MSDQEEFDRVAAIVREDYAAFKAQIDHLNDVLAMVMRGEIEASKILPPGLWCEPCRLGEPFPGSGYLADWACERADCPAGRPAHGVMLADLVSRGTPIDGAPVVSEVDSP